MSKISDDSQLIDTYGFRLSSEESRKQLEEVQSEEYKLRIRKENGRVKKWLYMLDNWSQYFNGNRKGKLKSRIRKGIPNAIRARAWKQMVGVDFAVQANPSYYRKLLELTPAEPWKSTIDKDLDRTFPNHCLFYDIKALGQSSLRNVLYAYAIHDQECGYCQGMGFIGALMLMLMTEEEAFWMLVNLLKENGKYQLRGLFVDGLPLLHLRFFQFQKMLDRFIPAVGSHLEELGVAPQLYCSKWFITIFCYDFPFETSMRIWDIFLSEGIKCVFRIGLTLIKQHEKELMVEDFGEALTCLQNLPKSTDTKGLIALAFKWSIKHTHLNTAALDYQAYKEKEEKERQERKQQQQLKASENRDKQKQTENNDKEEKQDENEKNEDENDPLSVLDKETGVRKNKTDTIQVKDYMLEEENVESMDHQYASDSNIQSDKE